MEVERRHRCVYCGHPTRQLPTPGRPVTCTAHSDLPALDPHYNEQARLTSTEHVPA